MRVTAESSYVFIFVSILLTTYFQLVLKWQSHLLHPFPENLPEQIALIIRFLLNPWVLSTFVTALLSMICWSIGISRLPVSTAYPFVGITFALVVFGGAFLFHETIQIKQLAGTALIIFGVLLVGQS